jgi:hypothetical protein
MQFWKYEILILVLLKTGSTEWSVHGGDAHGAPEEDMLDVYAGADLPRHLSSRLRNLNKVLQSILH